MNLKPLGDRIIVEVLEEEQTTVSGIVLPDTAKEKPQRGTSSLSAPATTRTASWFPSTSPSATRSSSRSTAAPRSRSASTST